MEADPQDGALAAGAGQVVDNDDHRTMRAALNTLRLNAAQLQHRVQRIAHENPRLQNIAAATHKMAAEPPALYLVGLSGETGAGKSTLINGLMDLAIPILPGGDGGTSAVPTFVENIRGAVRVTITVRYVLRRRFNAIIQDALHVLQDERATGDRVRVASEVLDFAYSDGHELNVPDHPTPEVAALIGTTHRETYELNEQELLRAQEDLRKVSTGEEVRNVLVASVVITGPFPHIPECMQLVDLPGCNDVIESRAKITANVIARMDAVMFVSTLRHLRTKTFWATYRAYRNRRECAIVISRASTINLAAASRRCDKMMAKNMAGAPVLPGGVARTRDIGKPGVARLATQLTFCQHRQDMIDNDPHINLPRPPNVFAADFHDPDEEARLQTTRGFPLDPIRDWLFSQRRALESRLRVGVQEFNALLRDLLGAGDVPLPADLVEAVRSVTTGGGLTQPVDEAVQNIVENVVPRLFADIQAMGRSLIVDYRWNGHFDTTLYCVQRGYGDWCGQAKVWKKDATWNADVETRARDLIQSYLSRIRSAIVPHAKALHQRLCLILGNDVPRHAHVLDEASRRADDLPRLRPIDPFAFRTIVQGNHRAKPPVHGLMCPLYRHDDQPPAVSMSCTDYQPSIATQQAVGQILRNVVLRLIRDEATHARNTLEWYWNRCTAALTLSVRVHELDVLRSLAIDLHNLAQNPAPLHVGADNAAMAVALDVKGVPFDVQCPLTMDVFEDPVRAGETGNVYERAALQAWIDNHRDHPTSPLTRRNIKNQPIQAAPEVAARVAQWRQARADTARDAAE